MEKEQELIHRLQSDKKDISEAAFAELISQYKERLYWHIRNIVKVHDDADDVLQDTFIKIFRNIKNFKGESKLYSWMYRIATNEAITAITRKAKMMQVSSEEVIQLAVESLESDIYFEGNDIQLKLQQAIAKLPEKQQLVFNMKYFQEMKYKDMSAILDTTEGALKASYHIAVKKIEAYLNTD